MQTKRSKIIFKQISYNQRHHCMCGCQLYLMAAFLIALPQLTQGCCLPVCPVCQNQTGTRADHQSCLAWSSFLPLRHCSTLNWKQKMGDQLQTYSPTCGTITEPGDPRPMSQSALLYCGATNMATPLGIRTDCSSFLRQELQERLAGNC